MDEGKLIENLRSILPVHIAFNLLLHEEYFEVEFFNAHSGLMLLRFGFDTFEEAKEKIKGIWE